MPVTREDKVDNKKSGGEGWAEGTAPGSRDLTEKAWKPQDNEGGLSQSLGLFGIQLSSIPFNKPF